MPTTKLLIAIKTQSPLLATSNLLKRQSFKRCGGGFGGEGNSGVVSVGVEVTEYGGKGKELRSLLRKTRR